MKRLCVSVSVLAFRIAELLIVVSGLLLLLSRMSPVRPGQCICSGSNPPMSGPKSRRRKREGSKDDAMSECCLTSLTGF